MAEKGRHRIVELMAFINRTGSTDPVIWADIDQLYNLAIARFDRLDKEGQRIIKLYEDGKERKQFNNEGLLMSAFQRATDFCCEIYDKLTEQQQEIFWNKFKDDTLLNSLMQEAEAEADFDMVNEKLARYRERVTEISNRIMT